MLECGSVVVGIEMLHVSARLGMLPCMCPFSVVVNLDLCMVRWVLPHRVPWEQVPLKTGHQEEEEEKK